MKYIGKCANTFVAIR